jgi:aryl-alcohol dehydrogenase-like predicted oxidoreductase
LVIKQSSNASKNRYGRKSNNNAKATKSAQHVSRLALGTVQFGLTYGIANRAGQVSRAEVKAMLQLASANGIDTLDTAIDYGESETCLGEVGTQGFKLVTKLPALPNNCSNVRTWVQQQLAASLSRLGVTAVYGLLLHRSEQLLRPNGAALYQSLQALKDSGQVQKVGVSIYAPSELTALAPRFSFDLVQAPFSLIDRRLYRSGWLHRLKDCGVEVHTRSAFLQGLLLMNQPDMSSKFAPWGDLWNTWYRWLEEHNSSAVQACLAYPLSFPEVDRVVTGADGKNQLMQIVEAASQQIIDDLPEICCNDEQLINPSNWIRQ